MVQSIIVLRLFGLSVKEPAVLLARQGHVVHWEVTLTRVECQLLLSVLSLLPLRLSLLMQIVTAEKLPQLRVLLVEYVSTIDELLDAIVHV